MIDKNRISDCFAEIGSEVEEDILDICVTLCNRYNLSEEDIVNEWMAYSLNNNEDQYLPSVEKFNLMERTLSGKKSISSSSRTSEKEKSQVSVYSAAPEPSLDYDYASTIDENVIIEETIKKIRTPGKNINGRVHSPRMSFSPSSYSQRTVNKSIKYSSRGDVLFKFGKNAESSFNRFPSSRNDLFSIAEGFSSIPSNARFMYDSLLSRLHTAQKQVDSVCLEIVKNNELKLPVETHHITMETTVFGGRVVCDGNGKLNTSSILLEGCLFNKRGENVQLQVTEVPEYSLFPGQIVAVEGKNPTGLKIIAEKLYADVKLPECPLPKAFLDIGKPLDIVVAAGPFMLSDNLLYEPLQDLINYVKENHPHFLILIGPIVDSQHPNILDIAESFFECYETMLKNILESISKLHTKVIAVNSWREASQLPVYPTPSVDTELAKNTNLLFVPDPCIISISGFLIGLTSTDVLMHLGKEELFCSVVGPSMDRLGRLAALLFHQKCFYPLMPPAEEMSIDLSMWYEYSQLPYKPHMMILPSDLRYYVKNIGGSIFVNPEKLTKGQVGGSFARIEVIPPENAAESWYPESHISVQIVKI